MNGTRFAALLLTLCVWGGTIPVARAQAIYEYDLKAVLLYNFTRFVEWPLETFAQRDTPWVIGILGRDPFGRVLDNVVRPETFQNRRIVVERYRDVAAVRSCHILFVAASEKDNLPRILAALRGRPILIAGDYEGFALDGGMIGFKKNPVGKIELRINLPAIRESGLIVSAKLLRVAEVVMPLNP